jgi:hypothetical protein
LLGPSTTHGDVTPRQNKRKGGEKPEQSRKDVEATNEVGGRMEEDVEDA